MLRIIDRFQRPACHGIQDPLTGLAGRMRAARKGNSQRHNIIYVFGHLCQSKIKRTAVRHRHRYQLQPFLILRTPFCALLWRWPLKNVGTCFLQAPRSKTLSIRYVFHGAGAPHRNSDAQKAHCFQQAVTGIRHRDILFSSVPRVLRGY